MVLGIRWHVDNSCGDLLRNPHLVFTDIADFLQYTKDLQDKIFHIATSLGSEKMVIRPVMQIKDISDDNLYVRNGVFNSFINPMTGEWEYRLSYFEFVDFMIGCIKENKKYNCLGTIITIKESLFNTFANGKFFEIDFEKDRC